MKTARSVIESDVILKEGDGYLSDGLLSKPAPSYARDLRVVGQLLERREIATADLVRVADAYIVRGIAKTNDSSRFGIFWLRMMRHLDAILRGDFSRSMPLNAVDLRYDLEEIVKSDYLARLKRSSRSPLPDPYSLSHLLRSAGAYVDGRKNSALIGISLQDRWVTIRFETAEGHLEEARQSLEYFYDYWVKMYLRRSGQPEKPAGSNAQSKLLVVK